MQTHCENVLLPLNNPHFTVLIYLLCSTARVCFRHRAVPLSVGSASPTPIHLLHYALNPMYQCQSWPFFNLIPPLMCLIYSSWRSLSLSVSCLSRLCLCGGNVGWFDNNSWVNIGITQETVARQWRDGPVLPIWALNPSVLSEICVCFSIHTLFL